MIDQERRCLSVPCPDDGDASWETANPQFSGYWQAAMPILEM